MLDAVYLACCWLCTIVGAVLFCIFALSHPFIAFCIFAVTAFLIGEPYDT